MAVPGGYPKSCSILSLLSFSFIFCSFIFTANATSLLGNTLNAAGSDLVTQDDSHTCTDTTPCKNGACCGSSGYCGFEPEYCGKGCTSNCNATAPCGKYAATPGQGCPLNVCCSEYGFCGMTTEFCKLPGCQSHCTQPKPTVSKTDVQKRVIGYWEAWNSEHPCGTMSPGEIPVNMLTHLNIAFGYITPRDYRITTMNGVSPDLYKIVGDLKQRNPDLKIMIALGGWAFSDPGTWQNVFPEMTSRKSSRHKFIQNLLGFLSEYGYDGVDFDWEYPGADDRGGSDADGDNYSQLLIELRSAIKSGGYDYTVTFTSPTSYWYMRHFDIKTMSDNADWVNLMSYDLHGVWDSDNPIGNNVLAHTNLTEIDLALDLFWRNDVDPSKIILGMAFYGRTFKLKDSSCWKPGCEFSSAGSKGSCTQTAGILSYREIQQIRQDTGGAAYLDKDAAVRYMVYDSNSWVSYDDERTFKMKIDYANKMGLGGLMVWAIDLDDGSLSALSAISGVDSADSDFDLVPLEYIFPPDILPSQKTKPSWGLITLGDTSPMQPNDGGFGFMLIAGDSHAVSNLQKRDGEPEPFHFLDCPSSVSESSLSRAHTARVVCLNPDVSGCFQITERGVEGTIVAMPENCASNTFARAISLKVSKDQSLGADIQKRSPTSEVYDFSFDYDMSLVRRDTDKTSVRLDYATFGGYWDTFVNSPGEGSEEAAKLMKRYWSNKTSDWEGMGSNHQFQWSSGSPIKIKEDVSRLIWWQTDQQCDVGDSEYDEAFAGYVVGDIDAEMHYGFSLYGNFDASGELDIKKADGFVNAVGKSDLKYGISGFGVVDVDKANKGNPAHGGSKTINLPGSKIKAGSKGYSVKFEPYLETTYEMATFNGSIHQDPELSAANFDGVLSAQVIQDFSNITAFWPADDPDGIKPPSGDFKNLEVVIPASGAQENQLYYTDGTGGQISLGTAVSFGVKISMDYLTYTGPALEGGSGSYNHESSDLGTMALRYNTFAGFQFTPSSDKVCSDIEITSIAFQDTGKDSLLAKSGWDPSDDGELGQYSQTQGARCYSPVKIPSSSKSKRDENAPTSIQNDSDVTQGSDEGSLQDGQNFHNSSLGREDSLQSQDLSARDYKSFPMDNYNDFNWKFASMTLPPLARVLLDFAKSKIPQGTEAVLKPDIGKTCLDLNVTSEKTPCCGCYEIDWYYGYGDIPPYDDCVACSSNDRSCSWPHGYKRGSDFDNGRFCSIIGFKRDGIALVEDDVDDYESHTLYGKKAPSKSNNPKATISIKTVSVCGLKFNAPGEGRYPAFPKLASKPWNGIENGRWDSISRYWGNKSASCMDWGVTALPSHDTRYIPSGKKERARYETEHVFEGQLIGDFFTEWLNKGQIRNQVPTAINPSSKMGCADIKKYVTAKDPHWIYKKTNSFIHRLLFELGSELHLDRLTIFLGRPNGMKGSMFRGVNAISANSTSKTSFKKQNADAQLQSVKEMGMVFEYINNSKVWEKFCNTFEAIYEILGEFDDYHSQRGTKLSPIQDEWPKYIHTTLKSIGLTAQNQLPHLYRWRAEPNNAFFNSMWGHNVLVNYWKLSINGTCKHLPAQ